MKLIGDWGLEPQQRFRAVLSIGAFDGLHLGHKSLIDMVITNAARLKVKSLILTFEPHPLEILAKQAAPPLLTPIHQKAEILKSWGLDYLGILGFTKEMASLEPQKFLYQFISKYVDPVMIILGPDFSFGKNAQGGAETIKQWLSEIGSKAQLVIAEPFSSESGLYSSSQIRQDLKNGLIESATKALGRPYRLYGQIIHGQARGRTLGFPTANLGEIIQLVPEPGVYAVKANINGKAYGAMTSIGYNPTFGEQPMTIETNIFDFERFIYGEKMFIDFIARLRPMIRFKSPQDLISQLKEDCDAAQKALL